MTFTLYGESFSSRLLLGTAQYPSPAIIDQAIKASGTEIITVSLRREISHNQQISKDFWHLLKQNKVKILPNTAGCKSIKEAVTTAEMAREIFATNWIKLELTGDEDTLQPDLIDLVAAADILINKGFCVFPYTTEDLTIGKRLFDIGCQVIMPWAAPIGSAQGLNNLYGLKTLRGHLPQATLIVDAGIGAPSHASQAMEIGYDAILLNTAVAKAANPVQMAAGFKAAIIGGRHGFEAGIMPPRDMASPSTPVIGKPF